MHGVENEFMVRYLKGGTARLLCRHHRAPRADCFLGTEASELSKCGLFPGGPDAFAQIGAAGFERSINRLGKDSCDNLELFHMRDTPFLRPSSDRSMLAQTGSFTSASTGARGCEALRRAKHANFKHANLAARTLVVRYCR